MEWNALVFVHIKVLAFNKIVFDYLRFFYVLTLFEEAGVITSPPKVNQ